MDILQRGPIDEREVYRAMGDRIRAGIHVAIPVQVTKDSDGHVASLQPLIKSVRRNADGSQELIDFPPILEAPIAFPSGGGTTHSFPVKGKDFGYMLVASRDIDVYQQNGGIEQQVTARIHDLSDGIYVPGLKPDPKKLKDYNSEAAELRSDDGKHRSSLHPKNGMQMIVDKNLDTGKARHEMAWHPDNGISASVEHGKHKLSLHPSSGIGLDTSTKLAVKAKGGMKFTGAAHFDDSVTSSKSFGAPTLNGTSGGPFTGMAHAIVGGLVGAGMMFAMLHGQRPPETAQRAAYTFAGPVTSPAIGLDVQRD